jgi:hypothetical protein
MKNGNISLGSLKTAIVRCGQLIKPYIGVLFFILFAAVYGIVILRISALNSAQPPQSDVDAQVQASPSLHIDANAVKQLETLKDNSVNVQSLFEQDRTNPFQE